MCLAKTQKKGAPNLGAPKSREILLRGYAFFLFFNAFNASVKRDL